MTLFDTDWRPGRLPEPLTPAHVVWRSLTGKRRYPRWLNILAALGLALVPIGAAIALLVLKDIGPLAALIGFVLIFVSGTLADNYRKRHIG